MPSDSFAPMRIRRYRGPLLMTFTAFFWFSLYTYPAILTPYLSELGASLTSAGLVVGSYGLTQTLLRLPAGIWSDRLQNKKVFIIAGSATSLISAIGLLLSRQVELILLFRALSGVAAATWVHTSTLYMAYQTPDKAPKAMGQLNFINSIGSTTAMLAGSALAQTFGWRYAFLTAVAGAVICLVISLFISEDKPEAALAPTPITLQNTLGIGRDRLLFWTSILALLAQFGTFATIQGFVPQYASLLGADKAQIGLLSALSVFARAFAGLLGGGLLARRFKLRSLIVAGFGLTGLSICLLPLVNNLPLLFINQILAGIGIGFQITLLMSLCTRTIPAARKASAMGFFQAVYGIGMVCGPVLIGFLADQFSLGAGFLVIGTVTLLSGLLALIVL